MIRYEVTVVADLPYPIGRTFTVMASGFPAAISRGIRLWRADPRIKRRKVISLRVKANRLVAMS